MGEREGERKSAEYVPPPSRLGILLSRVGKRILRIAGDCSNLWRSQDLDVSRH